MKQDTQSAVAEATIQLWNLIDKLIEAAVMVDSNQVIVMFNKAARELFGYEPDDRVIGLPLDVLLPVEYRQIHRQHVGTFHQDNTPARHMNNRQTITGLKKSGETFEARATIAKSDTVMMAVLREVGSND